MFSWKRGALLGLLLMAGGCYAYEPVRPADAIMDARVRATVSPEKAAELSPALRGISTRLNGTLAEKNEEGVLLEVPLFSGQSGLSSSPMKNRVFVSYDDLVGLETRSLSKWRTGTVLGVLVAGVSAAWVVVGGEDTADDKPKTGTDNSLIPLLSIPLSFLFR